MRNIKACLSHNSDDWRTPKEIYDLFINKLGCIDCFKYQSSYDEFNNNYKNKKLFINPPFSKLDKVTQWIIKQYKHNNVIWLLIPSRTDTKYFHKLLELRPTIFFIKGRLKFNDSKSAPFPTMLLLFDKLRARIYAPVDFKTITLWNH